jgi:hypothetical protein
MIRVAMWLIWCGWALLALAITLFAFGLNQHSDVGTVFGATYLLGIAGTTACLALLGGSALGVYAIVGQPACRSPLCVLTILAGFSGGTFLAWIAWGFWGMNR